MRNDLNNLPQIKAVEQLYNKLENELPNGLFNEVHDTITAIIERLKLQMEITEFLTNKLVKLAE